MSHCFTFQEKRDAWPEHFSNGGTGVLITSEGDWQRQNNCATSQISESVTLFNDPSVYMRGSELHTTRKPVDLSDFWKFHRERFSK